MKTLHVLLVSLFALQALMFASTPTEATRLLRFSLGFGARALVVKVSLMRPPRPPHPRHLPPPPPSPGYSPEPGPGLGSPPRPFLVVPAAPNSDESISHNKSSHLNPSAASAI